MTEHKRPSMGVMHLNRREPKFHLSRIQPAADIGFFVKHYWIVSWDLTGEEPYSQSVIPNPCANLVVEKGGSFIYGAAKHVYEKRLQGSGSVFGIKFRPGGLYPFIRQPVTALYGRPLEVGAVLGTGGAAAEALILGHNNLEDMAAEADKLIRPMLPEEDGTVAWLNQVIDHIQADKSLTRVEDICIKFDVNKRTLQRLFSQYVGLTPKWVIKLCRLQHAAEVMDQGGSLDLLQLAHELGYHDQPHFIRDFKAAVGVTPASYMAME
ncbi:AraC family transcriptional regulator [Paenibacillus tarimensis]|uniref:AraC family transcriptional regulator n=1 Tax=Paenibacillus tarimensis TaxID=416012 RepID=UPI001F357861|nr:helix-turn-helix domain-containing protein [Paenibacillus tarimensis]MCF2945123.1 helix-turn-helix domain-containing protein [Paenibacillus tarimensis]